MLDGLDERCPCPGSEAECGARLVLRVADGHDARSVARHFDAVAAVAAVAGLAPAKIVYTFHFSSATFNTISRDCACGRACCRTRSKATSSPCGARVVNSRICCRRSLVANCAAALAS